MRVIRPTVVVVVVAVVVVVVVVVVVLAVVVVVVAVVVVVGFVVVCPFCSLTGAAQSFKIGKVFCPFLLMNFIHFPSSLMFIDCMD